MRRFLSCIVCVCVLVSCRSLPHLGARVAEIVRLLPVEPAGLGPTIADREAWERIAELPAYRDAVRRGVRLVGASPPPLPESLYLEFSETGNRRGYERAFSRLRGMLRDLVIAECIEAQGRFLPAAEAVLSAVCDQPTWVLPAHDRGLDNLYGRRIDIDLVAASTGWTLATALHLLGDHLDEAVAERVRRELQHRIFGPYLAMVRGTRPPAWWMRHNANWNAVCTAGVVGAALAVLELAEERAVVLAGMERSMPRYLAGFGEDGYCSEGLAYWNYGFGHFILLAETVRRATGGAMDPMGFAGAARAARFPAGIRILPGVYPAFADCPVRAEPVPRHLWYISRRYGYRYDVPEQARCAGGGTLYDRALFCLSPHAAFQSAVGARPSAGDTELRSVFPRAGVFVFRPSDARNGLGVALKGGHNGEHHNHNDVGSFVCAVRGKALLVDPGKEVYTARTFSPRRYESDVINSFGHPVPVVSGSLQRTGVDACGTVLSVVSTDRREEVVLDMTAAYDVPELELLERTFRYRRNGDGRLVVVDTARFSRPARFESAVVTFSAWEEADGGLRVRDGDAALHVAIDTGGASAEIVSTVIDEDLGLDRQPVRIGIRLVHPTREARIRLVVTPDSSR